MVLLLNIAQFLLISSFFLNADTSVIRETRQAKDDPSPDLFEGDIAGISPDVIEDLKKINKDPNVQFGAPIDNLFQLWPEGTVYYKISQSFSADERQVIQQAIDEYHQKTCIKFVPQTNEAAYIKIVKGEGCHSVIGRTGRVQELSLGKGCVHKGTAIHEFMHALGFFHEQSRWDRDNYISVRFENIQDKQYDQFLKHELGQLKNLGLPYDYSSVMHYGKTAFSKNGRPTIVTVPDPNVEIGQRKGLSETDVKNIRSLYKCGGDVTTTTKKTNKEFLQQGVRLANHYAESHVDNVGDCIQKCKSDDKCKAISHTLENWTHNCFLYKDGYSYGYDSSKKFSSWTKSQIELGMRLFNHYDASFVDNAVQCKSLCANDGKCKAMTFDSGKTYSNGNCFLFQSYRMQLDEKMQWLAWRKRERN